MNISRSKLYDIMYGFIPLLFLLVLYYFPLELIVKNYILGTIHEEPVGYYYFYSLRTAFGGEYPWLPQSQFLIIIGVIVQHLLSFLGLPEGQFLPRIKLFENIFVIIPFLLSVISVFLYSSKIKNKCLLFFSLVYFYYIMSSPNLPSGYGWLTTISYQVWLISIVFFSIYLMPSFEGNSKIKTFLPSWSWYLCMGVFIGVVATIKITFTLLPALALILNSISQPYNKKTYEKLSLSIFIALLVIFGIMFKNVNFSSFENFQKYFHSVLVYYITESKNSSVANYDLSMYPSYSTFIIPIGYFILIFWSIRLKNLKIFIIGLLSLLATYFLRMRFYSHTLIEYHANSLILIFSFYELLNQSINLKKIRFKFDFLLVVISIFILANTLLLDFRLVKNQLFFFKQYGFIANQFYNKLLQGNRKIFILTTENNFRPSTLESALCKGAMNIDSGKWEDSKYINTLFFNYYCTVGAPIPDNFKNKLLNSNLGFSVPDADLNKSITRIEKYFSISLKSFNCYLLQESGAISLAYCYPKLDS